MHDVKVVPFAVDELVRVREALADAHANEAGLLEREGLVQLLSVLDDALQVGAVDELHDDEVGVVADADVEHLNAVRVREVRADARLVEEHPDELLLLGQVRENALDGDELLEALESRALGAEHLGHTAGGDALENLVTLGRLGGHRRGSRTEYGEKEPTRPARVPRGGFRAAKHAKVIDGAWRTGEKCPR